MTSRLAGSFRDRSGFVFVRDGRLYRQVDDSFREEYDALTGSGLYDALVEADLLVPHEEVDVSLAPFPGAYRVLRPRPVPFVSYPYEWTFGQLRDAALLTLQIQRLALEHRMSLRDASAYNVQFVGSHPILIDTLSFERLREGEPWVAYRQFCQHFLAPLALMRYRDVRLGQLLRVHLDGVPLDLATALLPRRARVRPALLMHVFLHARSQARHAEGGAPRRGGSFSKRAFEGLVQSLDRGVRTMRWDPPATVWSSYYGEADSYVPEASEHKIAAVSSFLDTVRPSTVWDLGGNTGRFSRLATARGATAVCFDMDPAAVELNYREAAREDDRLLLPLVMDLTNPSPGIGWENRERMSLRERGPVDLVLALALVHHLAIGNNVPLGLLAAFLSSICRWLVVEFVPKDDPKVGLLLASRADVFPDYDVEGFEAAFGARFAVERREPISGSGRVLYLLRSREAG